MEMFKRKKEKPMISRRQFLRGAAAMAVMGTAIGKGIETSLDIRNELPPELLGEYTDIASKLTELRTTLSTEEVRPFITNAAALHEDLNACEMLFVSLEKSPTDAIFVKSTLDEIREKLEKISARLG